jgi:hypothetical protein
MSYAKVIAGLGIALVALLALGAGITLAAQWRVAMQAPPSSWTPQAWGMHGMGWGMTNKAIVTMDSEGEEEHYHHCPMMKGEFKEDKGKHVGFANLITISGTVKSVNLSRGFIVVTSGGKDYNVFVKKEYVRTSDGALVFSGWILGSVKPGDDITVKGFGKNSNILAVEITWKGNTYQVPAYYMFLLRSRS